MKRWSSAVFIALFLASARAMADEPPGPADGKDMAARVRTAAALDGSWSLVTQYQSLLIDRGLFTSDWAKGLTAHVAQKALYGTSWTLLVGGEAVIAVMAAHGDVSWIGSARYRTDWMVPLELPSCAHVGANGGCGLGQGGFAFLQMRPRNGHWWFEVGGGSFDERVSDDALREVGETTWVLTPLTALYELATPSDWPVAVKWQVGPGIFGGMLNRTIQPTSRGQDVYRNQPWTELYPRYYGVGPGGRTELSIVLGQHITLDGDLTVAPLFVAGATWRKLDFGIGYQDPKSLPFKPSAEVFAAELSNRPLEKAGYRGVMMRFDIPLRE